MTFQPKVCEKNFSIKIDLFKPRRKKIMIINRVLLLIMNKISKI